LLFASRGLRNVKGSLHLERNGPGPSAVSLPRRPQFGRVIPFFVRRWFLLFLAVALLVGWGFSSPLEPLIRLRVLREGIVVAVLFLMALPLEARAVWAALRRPWAPLLACAMNAVLAPLIAWGLSPLLQESLGLGLLVAAATPCTLASASVWTRRAGGNDAVAILVTVLTNLFCFVVTPFWLYVTTGTTLEGGALDVTTLVQKLALLVVLPMLFAQLLRCRSRVAHWATRQKLPLGVLAQFGVLMMIFLGSIQMGRSLAGSQSNVLLLALLGMLLAVAAVHLLVLVIGIAAARFFSMSRPDQIAVGIAGSQKTLMVGLQVSMDMGVSILPMVAYHVGQLLLDTVIVDRWRGSSPQGASPE
jgi:solute carrier family 10 (sodium/bile acid cotransporter), member 7